MTATPAERVTTLSNLVAEEILALLGRRRMSQRRLALMLGKSPAWLNYRLTGVQAIDLNDLAAIAAALDVPLTKLLPEGVRSGGKGADTLQNRRVTDQNRRVTERTPIHVTGHGPHSPNRHHKPDTSRHDPHRPRILPRPGVGAA